MSAAVGAVSANKDVSFNVHLEEEHKNKGTNKVDVVNHDDVEEIVIDEDEEEEHKVELDLGPQFSLKEQLEKDKVRSFSNVSEFRFLLLVFNELEFLFLKDDESLRKWKEQLLGNVDVSAVGGTDFIATYLLAVNQVQTNFGC